MDAANFTAQLADGHDETHNEHPTNGTGTREPSQPFGGMANVMAAVKAYVALVAAITLVTGILFLLLALFRMGWISQFLSKAVITGFLFGAAIEVVIGELRKLTGTEASGSNAWQKLLSWAPRRLAWMKSTMLMQTCSALVRSVPSSMKRQSPGSGSKWSLVPQIISFLPRKPGTNSRHEAYCMHRTTPLMPAD